MSEVTGVAEVVTELHALGDALGFGESIVDAARDLANRKAPSRAQLVQPAVNYDGATLHYSGVIFDEGFQNTNNPVLEADAVGVIEDYLNDAIQKAGLQ